MMMNIEIEIPYIRYKLRESLVALEFVATKLVSIENFEE